jgi:phosphotriesterase-related protein
MTRRELVALAAAPFAPAPDSVLVHEHILVDFTGGAAWDRDEVIRAARPKLEEVARLGCRRLQECTPSFLGRDPRLLRRLADSIAMEIWTNTGIYGAANHKFVPAFALEEPAERLAGRWIAEARAGVDGMTPRFIKTGVNKAPLDEVDRKLVRAAAIASRETGLTIASHTGDGPAALEQLDILASEKVPPVRFVWVHAQNERDHAIHERVARGGAWVEFDGIGAKSLDWHLECVRHMATAGLLGRTLVSQDAGWYHAGEPGGGDYRPYTFLYTDFLPRLASAEARQLMWENPRRAFGS